MKPCVLLTSYDNTWPVMLSSLLPYLFEGISTTTWPRHSGKIPRCPSTSLYSHRTWLGRPMHPTWAIKQSIAEVGLFLYIVIAITTSGDLGFLTRSKPCNIGQPARYFYTQTKIHSNYTYTGFLKVDSVGAGSAIVTLGYLDGVRHTNIIVYLSKYVFKQHLPLPHHPPSSTSSVISSADSEGLFRSGKAFGHGTASISRFCSSIKDQFFFSQGQFPVCILSIWRSLLVRSC